MARAWVFKDNVSTDSIIPGRFNITTDPNELLKHVFKYARPEFAGEVKEGDIVIGGKNFGCGSSREHAAIVLKACGIRLVAESYGWIFKRNCINTGIMPFETVEKLTIEDGSRVELDLQRYQLIDLSADTRYKLKSIPKFIYEIYKAGGLTEYLIDMKGYR